VLGAESGLEGLRLVRKADPDLVILDVVMPAIDGYKIAAAIKRQRRFVPVILLTSLQDVEAKRCGQAAGADDFLCKPVSAVELEIRVAAMLRIGRLTAELAAANGRLLALANTDGLTGLPNRRRFDEIYKAECHRGDRYARPLSALLVDVDHFKRVNDTYGHPVGDEVLRRVADALKSILRSSDHVARYGGEEFAILAPETGREGASLLAERIRREVELLEIPVGEKLVRITCSVGVAVREGGLSSCQLIRRADMALYQAKHSGRNRVA
jgi:diguanylate cyclase (GGDEF)-like protein